MVSSWPKSDHHLSIAGIRPHDLSCFAELESLCDRLIAMIPTKDCHGLKADQHLVEFRLQFGLGCEACAPVAAQCFSSDDPAIAGTLRRDGQKEHDIVTVVRKGRFNVMAVSSADPVCGKGFSRSA